MLLEGLRIRALGVLISGFWGLVRCIVKMFGCECFCWSNQLSDELFESEPQPYSLPAPLPQWPPGNGFGSGRICLGEIEVLKITKFKSIWSCKPRRGKMKGIRFYKPIEIPDGFFCLGHYCQHNDQPLRGHILVAREITVQNSPALRKPINYTLIWSTDTNQNGSGYFWFPNPPQGYKAMGFVVTNKPEKPSLDEVRCVREDLTETSEACHLMLNAESSISKDPFQVWKMRPFKRGINCSGVSVGTFFCRSCFSSDEEVDVACLKNLDSTLHAMPNLNQIHSLINHYGPTVYFHPDEVYLPSSVQWFFKNGALLYRDGKQEGEPIDCLGSKLPCGETNDGEFWIDLPSSDDEARSFLKRGNIESAELYVHVKPALGGTFTDIAMWVFCPFNGPATLKVGLVSIEMSKVGEHVGDWEHYTLRICNFSGELWQMYFSEHSGGGWVDPVNLEFIKDNKTIVYSSKNGHASFPHPGTYLQGSSKLGIGARNDCSKSDLFVDSSTRYQIVSAEYLGEGVVQEPCWLQYMREWGPTIVYDSRSEVDKIVNSLPFFFRFSVENLFDLFPTELYGEEGPTGPKEKNNWEGDERW